MQQRHHRAILSLLGFLWKAPLRGLCLDWVWKYWAMILPPEGRASLSLTERNVCRRHDVFREIQCDHIGSGNGRGCDWRDRNKGGFGDRVKGSEVEFKGRWRCLGGCQEGGWWAGTHDLHVALAHRHTKDGGGAALFTSRNEAALCGCRRRLHVLKAVSRHYSLSRGMTWICIWGRLSLIVV